MSTKISWCDETINPVVGCSKISAGCDNCYAEKMARRLAAMGREQYKSVISQYGEWSRKGATALVPSELDKPYKWKAPRSIFVSSMGDLFHDSVPFEWIYRVLDCVKDNPRHTFLLLTKRPVNMFEMINEHISDYGVLPNLILGVSVEDQQTADKRIPTLIRTPAAKRFVSIEPMLGPVDLMNLNGPGNCRYQVLHPIINDNDSARPALDGVILGGESGSHGRRLEPAWVCGVRDQCAAAGVPFMFKQWNHENRNEVDPETGFPWLNTRTHTDLAWGVRK